MTLACVPLNRAIRMLSQKRENGNSQVFFWNNFTIKMLQRSKEVNQGDLRVNCFLMKKEQSQKTINCVLSWDSGVAKVITSRKSCDIREGAMAAVGEPVCCVLPLSWGVICSHNCWDIKFTICQRNGTKFN